MPILALTLLPAAGEKIGTGWQACLVCGQTGLASAILNVFLFVPFGAAIGALSRRPWAGILAGALLSVSVEFAQQFLPGRNPTLGDLVFNTAGAAAGAGAAVWWRVWILPSPGTAGRLALGWAGVASAVIAGTAWAAAPVVTDAVYYGLWTPRLSHLETYDGTVQRAYIDGVPIPAGAPFPDREDAIAMIRAWRTVEVSATAGGRPPALAPVVAVFDSARRELVQVGIDREDVVLRYRRRAAGIRLMDPQVRLPGAAAIPAGSPLRVSVSRDGAQHCLTANDVRRCNLGTGAGDGWMLLRAAGTFRARFEALMSAAWIGLLLAPLGFWLRPTPAGLVALSLTMTILLLTPLAGTLQPLSGPEAVGMGTGILAGCFLGIAARAFDRPRRRGNKNVAPILQTIAGGRAQEGELPS